MKLHIGPGNAYFPGWINVDIFSNIRADIYSSALALPYERGTFSLVYASHVLEHFSRHMILAALSHWRDLLIEGGVLRLSVPNFEAVHEYYSKTGNLKPLLGLLYGGQDHTLNCHFIIFDNRSLTNMLEKVGFTVVRSWDWRMTEHAQFDDYSQAYLPAFQKDDGLHMSLNLEAVK
uniref:Putative methyltransferase n=1 Tax=viral metagenome TaxID=1070528 RepID=A0A6M3K6T6_9ZZZZ